MTRQRPGSRLYLSEALSVGPAITQRDTPVCPEGVGLRGPAGQTAADGLSHRTNSRQPRSSWAG